MKYFIVFAFLPFLVSSYYMKIGIISNDLSTDTTKKIWSMAQNYSTMMSLEPIVQETQWREHDSAADISRAICGLVSIGVDALVFLGPSLGNSFISSYSDNLGLPFVTAEINSDNFGKYQISMLPDTSKAAADFIVHFEWDRFIFFYDSHDGPDQFQKIVSSLVSSEFIPRVDGYWKTPDVQTAIRCIRELLNPDVHRRIVLATSEEFADKLAKELTTIAGFSILLVNPVGNVQTQTLSIQGRYMNTVTKFSVVESTDPALIALENRLKTLPSFYARGRTRKNVPETAIFHYDSSSTLNTMFNDIAREIPSSLRSRTNMNCIQHSSEIPVTANYLRKVVVDRGVTGKIQFNQDGHRIDYKLEIINSSPNIVQKIGIWSSNTGLQLNPNIPRNSFTPTYAAQRSEPPLRVTSILQEPYLMMDNNTFRGFAVDFLNELSKETKLKFNLQLVKDGAFGYRPTVPGSSVPGNWNGMVGELIRGEADLCVATLTKTLERGKVIDFSQSIMEGGLNLLIKKQDTEAGTWMFEPFSFLTVWSAETWVVIVLAVVVYSAIGYGISRIIGAPDRVRALETKGTDNLSPCGSVWLTVGTLFCRDTGIYPRNLTHRLWALLWWIFCIFISLLYISMLTFALIKARTTVTTTHSSKTSQEVLKEFIETGVPIISAVNYGSTMKLFMNSEVGVYQQVGQFMKQHPEHMIRSHKEGVERVRNSGGKFAVIVESTTGELIASHHCDLLTTSGLLATRSFAVAMPKNSTLKELIDHGIITLKETGKLRELYEKWWHSEASNCEDPNLNILPKVYNTSMTLHEVSGIFYLFIVFLILSAAVAALEFYIRTRNITVR